MKPHVLTGIIAGVSVWLAAGLMFYLLGAISTWRFNPANWPDRIRVICAIFGLLPSLFPAVLVGWTAGSNAKDEASHDR